MYALGTLSREERLEVEAMAAKYPEVRNELHEIENSIQLYAAAQAVEPSEELRHRVLNSLVTNLADDRTFTPSNHQKATEAKMVQMAVNRKTIFYKYAFAASLVLLCLSIAALATLYQNLRRVNGQLVALQLQNEHYSRTVQFDKNELDIYRSSTFKLITLKGMPKSPSSTLTMAWSPVKKQVMVSTVHMKLPVNDKEHQYQLWALVNGKPVGLGVFDAKQDTTKGMLEMKPIAHADAFAVTLEPRGGSTSPTLDEMMLMAKL